MTARHQAIEDIKNELKMSQRCFLAYRKELNPVIDEIVKEYTDMQVALNDKYNKQ